MSIIEGDAMVLLYAMQDSVGVEENFVVTEITTEDFCERLVCWRLYRASNEGVTNTESTAHWKKDRSSKLRVFPLAAISFTRHFRKRKFKKQQRKQPFPPIISKKNVLVYSFLQFSKLSLDIHPTTFIPFNTRLAVARSFG